MSDYQNRDRPPGVFGWIISHPKTTALISVVVFLLLLVLLFQSMAESRLERRIAAIRAKGEPTCAGDLAAARPKIPDAENMTLRIEELGGKIEAFPIPEEWNEKLPIIGSAKGGPTGRRLPPEQLEAARWYLAKFPEEGAGIHEAAKLERGCAEIDFTLPLQNIMARSLSRPRLVAKFVTLEAAVSAEDGDADQAARHALDLCRLSRAVEHEPFVVGLLAWIAIDAFAASQIERTVNLCGLSDESLRVLQAEIGSTSRIPDMRLAIMGERVWFLDCVQRLRHGNPLALTEGGISDKSYFWMYMPILPLVFIVGGLEVHDAMVQAIDKPDGASLQRAKGVESTRANHPQQDCGAGMLLPSLCRAAALWVRSVGSNRAMQAALACERYRLSHGEWPADLDVLVPEYLEAVPVDPFDGQPIRYKRIPEGVCVWTIGEDLVDNGGDVMRLEVPKANKRASDWGWVLLNPDLRGLPAEADQPEPAAASEAAGP